MKKINRKMGKYIAILLFALVGYSCVSTRSLLIEIPRPAAKNLPSNIQSLTLVTQTVDENYTDIPADSLQKIFYKEQFNLDTVLYDLQMVDTTLQALGELLFESGRYDFVIPQNRFLQSSQRSSFDKPLPWNTVKEITETFDTDALLSFDYLKTRVIAGYGYDSFFDPYRDGFYSAARAQMQIYYEALFRVYDPVNEKIIIREFLRDTLYWEDTNVSSTILFRNFTPVKEALTEAGITIALTLSEKISVIWRTEQRKYFVKGDDALKQASEFVDSGDWQTAIALWKETSENARSDALKSKALFNIALGYEMLGNLDEAISWALKSYNTMYRPLTYEYLEVLRRRKSETNKQNNK